ncbi:MAG TPA: 4-(cytidine 5'-diphospho)-2-C-methyl-D-erythritol kinase [Deltaproteobacteria bacterium]|nr:4-(cytidine 5'-diphospho)-2-C-methyl-D-erythritol kinase [Deltaproteobacteria bacterium]
MSRVAVGTRRRRAPAKVNLGLRLVGVREDGYHLLESVFAPIGLADALEIEVSPGDPGIELEVVSAPSEALPVALRLPSDGGGENLVVRAARAFCRRRGWDARIRIRLEKRIPVGAGLGGGSSDAAAVLTGLASILDGSEMKSGRVSEELHELALSLGADVPFFLYGSPARVGGIGDEVEPLSGLAALDLVLVNPGIALATPEVYRVADVLRGALTDPGAGSTMRAISRLCGETGDLASALGDLLVNDLEPAARRLCPPVGRLANRLSELGSIGVALSGSGATVFGVFESAERAGRAAEALRAPDSGAAWVCVTRIIAAG